MAPETPSPTGESVKPAAAPKIYVMPEQFLAVTRGAGLPVAKAPPPPVAAAAPAPPKPAPTPAPAAPTSPTPSAPTGPGIPMEKGKRKMIAIWGIVGGVILVGGGLAAFFALRSVKPPAPPAPRNVAPVNVAPVPAPGGSASGGNVPPPAPEPEPEPPPAPDRDTDGDGLTDAEELLLGTDIGLSDSDHDSYTDAIELQNLYNPAGVAPQRILDAGLVYEYEHPTQGWSIYLPRQWSIAATDQEQRELLVTTQASGESFVITNRGAEVGASLCRGLPDFQAKRGANGCRNPSEPIAFMGFQLGNTLSIEHRIATPPARYPHLFDMIVQSFATSAPL